jgi:hypothetical protein
MQKRIFTFWEPRQSMPGYLTLCMRTWERFLPEYEIITLDYSNLDQWIGKGCYDSSLYKNFSLPKQADAIRCAALNRWGGIWFDTDTIVTSGKIHDLLRTDAEFTLLDRHVGFIVAQKKAKILRVWEAGAKLHIGLYKYYSKYARTLSAVPAIKRYMERWDFLGNSILRWPFQFAGAKMFNSIDKIAVNAFPELKRDRGTLGPVENHAGNYRDFYFSGNSQDAQDTFVDAAVHNGGLICLHNSWTPERYKSMSAEEFLGQNILLSKILKSILLP